MDSSVTRKEVYIMQQSLHRKLCQLILSALFLALSGSFMLSPSVSAAQVAPASTISSQVKPLIPNLVCGKTNNPAIYIFYSSPKGDIPLRIGYQNTPAKMGYGYCHILAKHPNAMPPVIQYILDYGQIVAVTPSSFTMRGIYATGQEFQVYISTVVQSDGFTKGIVSSYPYPGTD